MTADWPPSCSLQRLRVRAEFLAAMRRFMDERHLLEVETPALISCPVSDVQLHSAEVRLAGHALPLYLHTSPEYAMKRLLAAGSGDIYQLGKVFRGAERSALHNPEFTLLEWYRVGFSMPQLIDEITSLLHFLPMAGAPWPARPAARSIRYDEALKRYADIDLASASHTELLQRARDWGLSGSSVATLQRDELLDFIVAQRVGPQLGRDGPEYLTHYPASQAALARLDANNPAFALRFELYWQGIELANGFEELTDVREQAQRFAADQAERARRGLSRAALDQRFLAALAAGLPPCAGVALGVDRLLMIAVGAAKIADVLSFTTDVA
jgi:lysyl-tRNA synthetase class 2